MKHRLGIVFALGVGLFGQASALAQPAPAAAADQADPAAPPPPPPSPNPDAPPPPPPPGGPAGTPEAPPPVALPPYLTGNTTTPLNPPPPPPPPGGNSGTLAPPGPGADAGVTPKTAPARVRWRGTNLNWGTNATTTALGIGRDNIGSEGEQVSMGFGLVLNYFILEPKRADGTPRGYSFRVQTAPGFDVELTNSDFTTTKREPLFRDLPIQGIFSKPLWRSANEEWGLSMAVNGTVLLPTSKLSHDRGIYVTTSPRVSLFAQVPMRGKDADFLKNVLLGVSARWDHQFTRATVPTNPDIQRPRQTLQGTVSMSDQLTGGSIDTNSLRTGAFLFFDEKLFGHTLWVFLSGGLQYSFLNQPQVSDCVQITTGCADPGRVTSPTTTRYTTSFGVGVSYFPASEWGFSIDYGNANTQIGLDGKRRNPFYSPDATLSASLILSIDAIYERLTGPSRDDPFIVFGSNKKTRGVPQSAQREVLF
ncbi:hypothetical protein [Polyangium jinanense]|uniref:Uncharacterized protein n=1 Tax=Polyangium jinanense TaxID=2829994 RepID=A0A9X4ARL0_9BACT|nr:hypothetical protein [Polyangium jinanense]MDC3952552.1 hypothetical protein [Polyangium jinanense]MDC3980180.1 hypothetical protein [Polyangium jinanense]